MIILFAVSALLIALLIVFGIGRALGPSVKTVRFDETPADVAALDTSNGIPLDLKYDPLAIDEGGCCATYRNVSHPLTEEEQRRQLERLREYIQSEGRR
jgi:hypothetical protein